MNLDPVFYDTFAAYFNVDSLEADDPQQLLTMAFATASALKSRVSDPRALAAKLDDFLKTWDHSIINKLIQYSNVDWLANDAEKASLRMVISEIIKLLRE
jgi:hypothetical protein